MNEIKYDNNMSKKQKNICDAAKELAKKSDMEKSQHGAIIVNGKQIIGEGYNHHYNDNNKKKCYSCHAEVVAIVDAIKKYGKESLYNSELYVVRISKGNNIDKQPNKKKYRQDTSKKDTSRQVTSRQVTSRQVTSRQVISRQVISRQDTSRQDTSRQDTSRQDISRQDTSRQVTSKQDTSRQVTTMCDFRMSKPCKNCTNFIIKNNITTVFYSID
jgi:deoxycytidylate deaminase